MFKKIKGVVAGIIIGTMIGSGAAVAVGNTTTLYDVLASGIRIVIDGTELHPTDVKGNRVEPMIYNGTTYLPVRAVASALGKAVYWDGPNYTVYLGDMDGELKYPTTMLSDLTDISSNSTFKADSYELTDNYGNKYGSAVFAPYDGMYLEYLLAMKYSRFKGTLYIKEGYTDSSNACLTIKADGHIIYTSPEMSKTSAPVPVDVDVTGYNDVIIQKNGDGYLYLADSGFYQ